MEGRKQNYNIQEYEVDGDIRDEDNDNLHKDNSLEKEATHLSEFTGYDLKRKMEEFKESINAKVDSLVSDFCQLENKKMDYLVNEIYILKAKESCSCSLLKVQELQNEN